MHVAWNARAGQHSVYTLHCAEIELKFEMECGAADAPETWPNWQLRFLHNQLFERLNIPARFCPGPHHSTFVRKAAFRSAQHMQQYFESVDAVVREWRAAGPVCLEPETDPAVSGHPAEPIGAELSEPHGVYLFKTRDELVEYFPPNFHPPYDTPEKRAIITAVLAKEWSEEALAWKDRV